jgi:lipoyl-dependent peroxiredoxin
VPAAVPAFRSNCAIRVPNLPSKQVQALIEKVHVVCPYSNATRNNIDVTTTAVE